MLHKHKEPSDGLRRAHSSDDNAFFYTFRVFHRNYPRLHGEFRWLSACRPQSSPLLHLPTLLSDTATRSSLSLSLSAYLIEVATLHFRYFEYLRRALTVVRSGETNLLQLIFFSSHTTGCAVGKRERTVPHPNPHHADNT